MSNLKIGDKVICKNSSNSKLSRDKIYKITGITLVDEVTLDGVESSWRQDRFEKFYDEIDELMIKMGYEE